MQHWLDDNSTLIWWFVGGSILMFIAGILLTPMIVAAIPHDYFSTAERPASPLAARHPVMRVILFVLKNVIGYIVFFAGLIMLALPGQGLITIALGLILIDFPGKYRLQRWLVCRRPVLRTFNWLRRKRGRAPLDVGC